ncbi:hypothetical protein [Cystobacter fuscus]|uniref:hypothetical protein n=1 Tax=Cystobacter fuscus TaxID=43 RepID=UPI002B316A4A|nr:hypothetical protein F0U63_10580 [Cystobacter fuscus]
MPPPFRRFLLSTLLLSACGVPVESTSVSPGESLGNVDAALTVSSLRCARISLQQISCSAYAEGGSGPLTPLWQQAYQLPDQWEWRVNLPWSELAWTHVLYCEAPSASSSDSALVQVEFKVRDSTGAESAVKSTSFYCTPESIDLFPELRR